MSASHRFSVKGFYKEQFCRSLHEFHACLYLDKVRKVEFITEPFAMRSSNSTKRKIPDILYFDLQNREAVILEIKPNKQLSEEVLCEYANKQYRFPSEFIEFIKDKFTVKFQFLSNCSVKLKKQIIAEIGKDKYIRLLSEYRAQTPTYTGFPGKLNPMYGRKHSIDSKKLMSDKIVERGGHKGENNGMYGKTHTSEAKVLCTAKWKDPVKKIAMMRKGMLSHISKFTDKQYTEFMSYATDVLSEKSHKRPDFINRAYTVNQKNINAWFGDSNTFLKECKNVA